MQAMCCLWKLRCCCIPHRKATRKPAGHPSTARFTRALRTGNDCSGINILCKNDESLTALAKPVRKLVRRSLLPARAAPSDKRRERESPAKASASPSSPHVQPAWRTCKHRKGASVSIGDEGGGPEAFRAADHRVLENSPARCCASTLR